MSTRLYDRDQDPVLARIIFDEIHQGRDFVNIAGAALLERAADTASLGPQDTVLELGCGLGETCVYLAQSRGCRAVGLDLSRPHIEAARVRIAEAGLAERIEILEADATSWPSTVSSSRSFALALLLDTINETGLGILDAAWRALAGAPPDRGAVLAVAEILRGDRYDAELADWMESFEGVSSVLSATEILGALVARGFEIVDASDRTEDAIRFFDVLSRRLAARRDELVEASSERAVGLWEELEGVYRRAFEQGAMEYWTVLARRPPSSTRESAR